MADFRIRVIIDPSGARGGGREVRRELQRVDTASERTGRLLGRVFAFVGIVDAIRRLARLSDTYTEMSNRIAVAGEAIGNTNGVLEQLAEISNRTRTPVSQMVGLFQRGAIAAAELNATQAELLTFVEAVGKGFAIQGGSAARNAFALLQLSQALGSSIVRGEEFNSILEGAFPIALAAARGIERFEGSVAKLRLAIVSGKVTSEEFFRGILDQSEELDRTFATTVPTIGQAFTVFTNQLTIAVGHFNDASGTAQTFAGAIISLSNHLDRLVLGIKLIAVILISRYVTAAGAVAVATIRTVVGVTRLQIRMAAVRGASVGAAIGMRAAAVSASILGKAMAVLGGPFGLIALAAFAVYEFTAANRATRRELEDLPNDIDAYRDSIISLGKAQLALRQVNLVGQFEEQQQELTRLREELAELLNPQNITFGGQVGFSAGTLATVIEEEAARIEQAQLRLSAAIEAQEQIIELTRERLRAGVAERQFDELIVSRGGTAAIEELITGLRKLLKRLDPVATAQRAYAASVTLLTDAHAAGIIELETRDRLLKNLANSYRDQLDPLQAVINSLNQEIGLAKLEENERRIQISLLKTEQQLLKAGIILDAEKRAGVEGLIRTLDRLENDSIEELTSDLRSLQDSLDPLAAAQRAYASSVALLTDAHAAGIIELETRDRLLQDLAESYRDQLDPLQAVINSLNQEIGLAKLEENERRIQISLLRIEQDLLRAGITLDAEKRASVEDLIRTLDRLENANEAGINRNALVTREIELLDRQAEISRQVGDDQAASVARLNIEERIRQALREANSDLTEEEINKLARLSTVEADRITRAAILNRELARQADILEQIDGPARTFAETVESLTTLYNQGRISVEDFDRTLRELEITYLATQQGFVEGLERGLLQLQGDFSDLATQSQGVLTRAFSEIEDRLVEFVSTGKVEFHSLVDSILADLARIVFRQAILQPLAQNLTAALAGVFSPAATAATQSAGGNVTAGLIPRNASGGFISGPGSARSDSILARLSDGEFVVNAGSTRKFLPLLSAINSAPGFQAGGPVGRSGGRSFVTVNVIDQSTRGNNVDVEQQSTPAGETINLLIRDATDSNIREGRHDASLRGRFAGLNAPLVSR